MELKTTLKKVKSAESTVSMALGIVVVCVIGVILFNYFRGNAQKAGDQLDLTGISEENQTKTLPTKYTVVEGDDLWKISEKFYGTGYNWTDIAKENNLPSPNLIGAGQELVIPDVEPKVESQAKPTVQVASATNSISGETYTVVRGDTLWDISIRAYQDGYKWTLIAKTNGLTNPGLIHPGNTLVIPR